MRKMRVVSVFWVLCAVVFLLSGCELFKKAEPADLLPEKTQVMFQAKSARVFSQGMPENLRKLLEKAGEWTKALPEQVKFDPAEIDSKVKDFLGFDPLMGAAYEERGIDLDRPIAIALPALDIAGGVQEAIFIPVSNPKAFENFIRDILEKAARQMKQEGKIKFNVEGKITSIAVDSKDILYGAYHKGFMIFSHKKGTIEWLTAGKFEPLSKSEAFKKTMAPVGNDPDLWGYVSSDLIVLAQSGMGTALKLSLTYLDKWINSEKGIAFGAFLKKDETTSAFYLPVPEDGYFSKIFSGSDDVSGILQTMPPDAAVIWKELVNFKALFEMAEETLVFIPKARVKFDDVVAEFEKKFNLKLKEDVVARLGNGVLLVEYFRKPEKLEDFPKAVGFLVAVHTDGTPDATKAFKNLMQAIVKMAGGKGVVRRDLGEDSVLYSIETPGKEKMTILAGLVNGWLVVSTWEALALAPLAKEPVSPNLADAIAGLGKEVGELFNDPSRHAMLSDMAKIKPMYEAMGSMPGAPPEMGGMMTVFSEFVGSIKPSWAEWGVSDGHLWMKGTQKGSAAEISQMALAGVGIMAAVAIPNFLKFQTKARQSEAKTHLASIATTQIAFYAENNKWGINFQEIGWEPYGSTKYSYYLSCDLVIPSGSGYRECPAELKKWFATHKTDPQSGFHAAAVGNVDGDATLDIWIIDQRKMPENLVDDVRR